MNEEDLLSRPDSDAGRLQRACLEVLREHEAAGALPTSGRFVFYELLGQGIIPKAYRKLDGTTRKRTPAQNVADALLHLREREIVPWNWLVDETRDLADWDVASSVVGWAAEAVQRARIDCWDGEPPLLLVESRSLAGVLRRLAYEYTVPLAATNGQVGGFLHTEIAPTVEADRLVLYLGDLDLSGAQIEQNTRRVLEEFAPLRWERLALTQEQVQHYGLPSVPKLDNRYRPPRPHEAVETEALRQQVIVGIVRERLDALLPEPLGEVQVREQEQREQVGKLLALYERLTDAERGALLRQLSESLR